MSKLQNHLFNNGKHFIMLPLHESEDRLKEPIYSKWQSSTHTQFHLFPNNFKAVGILCGEKSNVIVVDVDVKNGKRDAAEKFVQEYKLMKSCKYIVQTASGGYHFYFKYDERMKASKRPKFDGVSCIDICSNKTQVVSEFSEIRNVAYKSIKGTINDIGIMPQNIIEFYTEWVEGRQKHLKKLKDNRKKFNISYIAEKITEQEKDLLLTMLYKPKMLALNVHFFDLWFVITIVLKRYGLKKEWDLWSRDYCGNGMNPSYNEKKNFQIWDNIDLTNQSIQGWTLISIQAKHNSLYPEHPIYFDCVHYTKITQKPTNTITINRQYILPKCPKSGDFVFPQDIKDALNKNKCVLLRSTMNSGKTTFFKKYIDEQSQPCISITSRVTLCDDQYNRFKKKSPHDWTHYDKDRQQKDHIVTTIDSLVDIPDHKLKDCIIYLDEISSILDYVVHGDHIKNRMAIFKKFLFALTHAYKIIGTDADINDACFRFFELLLIDYVFIENSFNVTTNIKALECNWEQFTQGMISDINNKQLFVVASDSKKACEEIYEILRAYLPKEKILLITREETQQFRHITNTANWEGKYVIYSPSIVYGVDFEPSEKYNVYSFIKGKSINGIQIGQQIFRCRKINNIYIHFECSDKMTPRFYTIESAREYIDDFKCPSEIHNVDYLNIFESENEITEEEIFTYLFTYYELQKELTKCDIKKYVKETIKSKGIQYDENKAEVEINIQSNSSSKNEIMRIRNEQVYESKKKEIIETGMVPDDENPMFQKLKILDVMDENTPQINAKVIDMIDKYIKDDYGFIDLMSRLLCVDFIENPDKIQQLFAKKTKNNEFYIKGVHSTLGKLDLLRRVIHNDDEQAKSELNKVCKLNLTDNNAQNTFKVMKHLKVPFYTSEKRGKDKKVVYVFQKDEFDFYKEINDIRNLRSEKFKRTL
jgi:hypothetical protein